MTAVKTTETSGSRTWVAFPLIFALLAAGIGFLALLGWVWRLPLLAGFGEDLMPMAPSTAALFLLFGVAIGLRARTPLSHRSYRISAAAGCLGAMVALLLFVLSCLNVHWAVEHLGLTITGTVGGAPIGHMSPVTAFCFLLVSASFLASLSQSAIRRWRTALALGSAGVLLGTCLIFLLAYLYGTPLLYGGTFIPPALNTILAFTLLGFALLVSVVRSSAPQGGLPKDIPVTSYVFLLVLVLLAAGFITVGYLYYRSHEQKYRAEVERQLSAIAELKVRELAEWRKERLGDGSILFKNAPFSALVRRFLEKSEDADAQQQVEFWIARLQGHYEYDRAFLLDTQGITRMLVPASPLSIPTIISQQASEVLRSGQMTLQDFYRNEQDQRVYLAVLVPIFDETDASRPLGVLVLRVDPTTSFYPYIHRWPTPSQTAETLLVRRDGNDALFVSEAKFRTNAVLSLRIALQKTNVAVVKAVLGRTGVEESVDYRGVPVIADVRPVPGSPWFLVTRMDTSEVYGPMRERLWQVVILVAILLFSAGACVGLLWWQYRARFYKERYESAEALRKSEEDYRVVVRTAHDGFWLLDNQGRLLDVNEAYCRLTGYSREQLLAMRITDIEAGESPEQVNRHIEQVMATGSDCFETRHRCANGRLLDLEVSATYAPGDGGRLFAFFRDITDRMRAEATLRESEARYRTVTQSATDAIITVNGAGMIVGWNQSAEKMFGYPEAEILGQPVTLLIPPRFRDRHLDGMKRVQAGGQRHVIGRTVELAGLRKDGSEFPLDLSLSSWEMPDGHFYSGILRDITERKRSIESQARLATAVEQAAESIMITDAAGAIVYVNPAFEKVTGYTRQEVADQNPRILKGGKADTAFYRQMWETLARGEVWTGHFINKRKDGTLYEEEATISPIRDAAGKVINYVAVKRDVTHEAQLEAQLRQAQKMEAVGRLAGGVAHDFNNLLTVMRGRAEMVLSQLQPGSTHAEDLREVLHAVERAANLTRQLLTFSRQQPLQVQLLDLNAVVNNTAKMLRRIVGEDITVHVRCADALPAISADVGMMEQVIMNLAVNARDAMPKGGQLTLEATVEPIDAEYVQSHAEASPGPHVCLSVSDTGCGIPAGVLPRIFEPFFTTKEVGNGTGLGLATVHGIVKQHNGWINVYSEVNHGTVFRIYLPAARTVAGVAAVATPLAQPPHGGTETILIVEDDGAVRTLMRLVLEKRGYRILEAGSGVAALELWKKQGDQVDLVLTDMVMPDGMSGWELGETLRADKPELKIIFSSGYSADSVGHEFVAHGKFNFLQKPYDSKKLLEMVRQCLDRQSGSQTGDGPSA